MIMCVLDNAQIHKTVNPNIEYRNAKQIRMTEELKFKTATISLNLKSFSLQPDNLNTQSRRARREKKTVCLVGSAHEKEQYRF